MSVDRRLARRLVFEPENQLFVHFRAGRRSLVGDLLDLGKYTLRVCAPEGSGVAWREGQVVDNVRLCFGDMPFRAVGSLRIIGVHRDARGRDCLRLQADAEGDRAALWLALDDLDSGEAALLGAEDPTLVELPRLPARGIYTEAARLERLEYVRAATHAPLEHAQETRLPAEQLTGNIENFFGSVEIPVGVAGPLYFRGQLARGLCYAPLATTEGALVASATRGCLAISRSGGVATRVVAQRMMRVPLFVLSNMQGAMLFANWIRDHVAEIREQTRRVSRHADLISVEPRLMGNMVHVIFLFETGDAAGQNMTTTCTWQACQWLMKQMRHFNDIRFDNFIIEANGSGDKKVNFRSFIEGRGTRVTAEAFLRGDIVEKVLKVTPEQLLRTNQGFLAGSVGVGMIGYNINVANIVAAIFAATGQDIACVHESSLAQLHLMPADDGVYASLLLPSLIVGTVGGGTGLPHQWGYLEMMGCAGPGRSGRFAEMLAGFALALDLSTLSAIAGGQFASAHEKLGRNRPVQWFRRDELDTRFFQRAMADHLEEPGLVVTSASPVQGVRLGSSILTELTARKVNKAVGHFPYALRFARGPRSPVEEVQVLVKAKPLDEEVMLMLNSMAVMGHKRLAIAHNRHRFDTGFAGCHGRELAIYRQKDPRFVRHAPRCYAAWEDGAREAYILVLERLQDLELMDTADDVSGWGPREVDAALDGIAQVHAIWYGREEELLAQPWHGAAWTTERMIRMSDLWDTLGVHAREEFPEWFGDEERDLRLELVKTLDRWWPAMEELPRTLIHNDFNPRNIALRRGKDGSRRLCAYDWELATLQVPQHDLAELLCFVLPPDVERGRVDHHVEAARAALERATGRAIPKDGWRLGYKASLKDLVVNRLAMYVMAHTFRHYGFMERVVRTARALLLMETGR